MKSILSKLLLFCLLPALWGCAPGRDTGREERCGLNHARLLSLEEHATFTVARIVNPWDTTRLLATYLLLPDSAEIPEDAPADAVVLRTPLRNALVCSTIHAALIDELGATEAVTGVCDADYVGSPAIRDRLSSGLVTDCGPSDAPDIEKVISLHPDAMLVSPYEGNIVNPRLEAAGFTPIICADYMELSPLGRAEWMKFYGRLFGHAAEADSLFAATEREYLAVKAAMDTVGSRPAVIFDGVYGGQWYAPRRDATLATYIRDAGGSNPFDNYPGVGSIGLSPENMLIDAGDADFWLIRYASPTQLSVADWIAGHPVYKEFKAAKTGNIYACNTISVPYFEETPFHPQWFLRQLGAILHPELGLEADHIYFTPL